MNFLWTLIGGMISAAAPRLGAAIADGFVSLLRRKGGVSVNIPILRTGYTAPQPPEGIEESRDLDHCDPEMKKRFTDVRAEFESLTGKQLVVTCTWRSRKKQAELYLVGRRGIPNEYTVTNCDGETSISRHNVFPSEAVDVAVDLDPGPLVKISWEETDYDVLGEICARHGLEWGGNFKKQDRPHIQLPKIVASSE